MVIEVFFIRNFNPDGRKESDDMEERIITVKKGEQPLDHLVELSKEKKTAWVFFDSNIVSVLTKQTGYKTVVGEKTLIGVKETMGAKQNAYLCLHETIANEQKGWAEVLEVSSPGVDFKGAIGIPEVILLLTMEE